jgi:hypothetical protein
MINIWNDVIPSRFTLWLFDIAMENGPFIDGLPNLIAWKWMRFTLLLCS